MAQLNQFLQVIY